MVSLTPPVYSIRDPVVLERTEPWSRYGETRRRVSRTATLDGGAVLSDLGATEADRTLEITARRITPAQAAAAERLARTYPTVVVSTPAGCFRGALEAVLRQSDELRLTVLVTERLDEEE